jgi:RNA polymerase sigma-19 factor, ECF subfamily
VTFPEPRIPTGHGETDAELVRRIREGDERALEVVFRAHFAGMAAFVDRYVRSPDMAEELVQDIFLKIWAKRARLAEIESLKTYLYRAARNQALNHLRRLKLERRWQEEQAAGGEPVTAFAADDDASGQELAEKVQIAINRLPPRCREIFLLSRDGGLTYNEIARTLEISVKTVETQMGRALKALRGSLGSSP